MKIEVPDELYRALKSRAAEFRVPLGVFINEALETKLRQHPSRKGKPWMKTFGGLKHLHEENVRIQKIIDEEFGKIEPEEWT